MYTTSGEPDGIVVVVQALTIRGLREDWHVTLSLFVDGHPRHRIELDQSIVDHAWHSREPIRLSICPSSLISFRVSRRHTIKQLGDKNVGTFDAPVLTFLANAGSELPLHGESTCSLSVRLSFEADLSNRELISREASKPPPVILNDRNKRDTTRPHSEPAISSARITLGQSVQYLDRIVTLVGNFVESNVWCKTAWTLLTAVYKAIKHYDAVNEKVESLSKDIHRALANIASCREFQVTVEALNVIDELTRWVAEGTVLIHEYMRRSKAGKAAAASLSDLEARVDKFHANYRGLQSDLVTGLVITGLKNGRGASSAGDVQASACVSWSHDCKTERQSQQGQPHSTNPLLNTTASDAADTPAVFWMPCAQPFVPQSVISPPPTAYPPRPENSTSKPVAAFPVPILHSDAPLTSSPDAMRHAIGLPEPCPYTSPSKPEPKRHTRPAASSGETAYPHYQPTVAKHPPVVKAATFPSARGNDRTAYPQFPQASTHPRSGSDSVYAPETTGRCCSGIGGFVVSPRYGKHPTQ